MEDVPSLLLFCVQRLAQSLIRYGPKKVRLATLSSLPRRALETLLEILVAKNALNDNVLPYALTRHTQKLGLEGATQLRRCLLNTVGRSCPNLRVLDVRGCQQVDNRIVRDVLQHCVRLETLRLDSCTRISDSAFAPALWKPPLAGLLGLRELSVGKCGQITAEGLMGYVIKGAPFLKSVGLAFCRLAITDEVASELLFSFGLEVLDLSFCAQISDLPFAVRPNTSLRELRLASTAISDVAVESLARRAPHLEVFDGGWVMRLTDRGVIALAEACPLLRSLCVCNTQVTDAAFRALRRCRHLARLDASWCLRASFRALGALAAPLAAPPSGAAHEGGGGEEPFPPLRELVLDHLGALSLDLGGDCFGPLPPVASPDPWGKAPPAYARATTSPTPWRLIAAPAGPAAAELQLPSLALPPPAQGASEPLPPGALAPATPAPWPVRASSASATVRSAASAAAPPAGAGGPASLAEAAPAALRQLVGTYAGQLEQLFLDGVRDVVCASALEAIAANCPSLQQLALTFPAAAPAPQGLAVEPRASDGDERRGERDSDVDAALAAGLSAVGASCRRLWLLRLDASARPHRALLEPLSPPGFGRLRSLTLWCAGKGDGLVDSELEGILGGRIGLESLALRNCEGLTEGLFPRWCNRGEQRAEEVEAVAQLDRALLSSLHFGAAAEPAAAVAAAAPAAEPPAPEVDVTAASSSARPPSFARTTRRRNMVRCPAAAALRSLRLFSLGGASALSDRSADALAELLHDAQTVDLRGGALLSEEALRSFRRSCRYLRSASIVTRERTLSWTASASTVRKRQHRQRKPTFHTSGSSGTESS